MHNTCEELEYVAAKNELVASEANLQQSFPDGKKRLP
jgi:hypothetical protein